MKDAKLREPVKRFAGQMELTLQEHDEERGEKGWSQESIQFLINRAHEELKEAQAAYEDCRPVTLCQEVIDVANFCMMIADNLRGTMGLAEVKNKE